MNIVKGVTIVILNIVVVRLNIVEWLPGSN